MASAPIQDLDNVFVNLLREIELAYVSLPKHTRVKLEKWVPQLFQYDRNVHEKNSRNNYLKLLQTMVSVKRIEDPFNRLPLPNESLPLLGQAQLNRLKRKLLEQPKEKSAKKQTILKDKIHPKRTMKDFCMIPQPEGDMPIDCDCDELQTQISQCSKPSIVTEKRAHWPVSYRPNPIAVIRRILGLMQRHAHTVGDNREIVEIQSRLLDLMGTVQRNTQTMDSTELRVAEREGADIFSSIGDNTDLYDEEDYMLHVSHQTPQNHTQASSRSWEVFEIPSQRVATHHITNHTRQLILK